MLSRQRVLRLAPLWFLLTGSALLASDGANDRLTRLDGTLSEAEVASATRTTSENKTRVLLEEEGSALDDLDGLRLLPVWDVLLVAYRNRDRLYDPSYAPLVHDRFGNATSVVLDDGKGVGQWDLGSSDDPLEFKVAPFMDWPDRRWDDVAEQAARIGALLGTEDVAVRRIEEPVDLLDSSRNRFLAPLSHR